MSEEIRDQACEDAGDELRERIAQFDACVQAVARELGACCGGVDGDQSDPHSTTAVLIRKIRERSAVTTDLLSSLEWLTNIACGIGRAGNAPEHGEVEAAIEASMHVIVKAKRQ